MTPDVQQTSSKLQNKKQTSTLGTCLARSTREITGEMIVRDEEITRLRHDTDGGNEQLRHGMATRRTGEALWPRLSSQCSQHGRDMWLARARRLIETPLAAAVWKIGDKYVLSFRLHVRSDTGVSSTDVFSEDIGKET